MTLATTLQIKHVGQQRRESSVLYSLVLWLGILPLAQRSDCLILHDWKFFSKDLTSTYYNQLHTRKPCAPHKNKKEDKSLRKSNKDVTGKFSIKKHTLSEN